MASDFTIDQVSWHTKAPGNTEPRERIFYRFWAVINFLQRNGLTTRVVASSIEDIGDGFSIRSEDLTPEGLSVMKKAYDGWLRKVDEGMSPDDLSVLERALSKILREV